jgi:hypothetical protein
VLDALAAASQGAGRLKVRWELSAPHSRVRHH